MSYNSQVELEASLDFYLQQFFSNKASDVIWPQSPSNSIQNVDVLNHPTEENLSPFPSQPLTPNHPSQPTSSGDSNSEYLSSPEAWTNSFNLVGFHPSNRVVEYSLQSPTFTSGSSTVSNLHTFPSGNNAKSDAVLALSVQKPEVGPLIRKRKRSTSYERVENSEGARNDATLKVFECRLDPECSETFSRVEHLARHERKHTKEKPFRCHCRKFFSRLDNWRQHKVAVHKHLQAENAETEKHLVEVQRGLQKLNKLRQATIVAATSQVKEPKAKKAKSTATNEPKRKREYKQASSPQLTVSGPWMKSCQAEFCPEQPTPENPSLVGSVESSSQKSNRTHDHSNPLTDPSLYSTDAWSRTLDFTPHGISPNLSDFSASPFPTPLNISRVIPFHSMNHSTLTHVPHLEMYTSSLSNPFPTYPYLDPSRHVSFQPISQTFTNHPPMMTHPDSGVAVLAYNTIPRTPSQSYHHCESFDYGTCNDFPSLCPEAFSTYSDASMGHYTSTI